MSLLNVIYGYDKENEFSDELNQNKLYSFQIETEDDNWIDNAYQYREEEDTQLEIEQQEKHERTEALLAEQSDVLSADADTGAIIYTPRDKKEEDQLLYHAEKQYELLADNSLLLNGAKSFCRYGVHQINKFVSNLNNDDNSLFDAEKQAKLDGFSDNDIEKFFQNVSSRVDYDYICRGVQAERNLSKYRGMYGDTDFIGKVIGVIVDSITFAKIPSPVHLLPRVPLNRKASKILDFFLSIPDRFIPSTTIRTAASGAFIGAGSGYLEEVTHYEMDENTAGRMALAGGIIGGALGCIAKGLRSQFVKNIFNRAQNEEVNTNVLLGETSSSWSKSEELPANNNWMEKGLNWLDTKVPVFKTPISVISASPSNSLKKLASELCDQFIPEAQLENASKYLGNAELKVKVLMKPFETEYGEIFKVCRKAKREITETTGLTPGQLLDRLVQERMLPDEALSLPVQTQQKFQKLINVMNETEARLLKLAMEVHYPEITSRPVLTPEGLEILRQKTRRGEQITFADYEELESIGLIKQEHIYTGKRIWDAEKVFQDENNKRHVLEDIKFSEGFIKYTEYKALKNNQSSEEVAQAFSHINKQYEINKQNILKQYAKEKNDELKIQLLFTLGANATKRFDKVFNDALPSELKQSIINKSQSIFNKMNTHYRGELREMEQKYILERKTYQAELQEAQLELSELTGDMKTKSLSPDIKRIKKRIETIDKKLQSSQERLLNERKKFVTKYEKDFENVLDEINLSSEQMLSLPLPKIKALEAKLQSKLTALDNKHLEMKERISRKYELEFNNYMASDAPDIEANSKLQTILDPTKFSGKFNDSMQERSILISTRETSKWHQFNTVSSYIKHINHMARKITLYEKLNKVAQEFGVTSKIENIDEFIEKVAKPELQKYFDVTDLTKNGATQNAQRYHSYAKKINELFNNVKLLCSSFDGTISTRYSSLSSQILLGIKKWMYGAVLGVTPISSLPDGINIIHTLGMKNYLGKMFNKEFQVLVDDCVKTFSKRDMKEILDACPYGIDKTLKEYLLRDANELFALSEYSSNKFIEKFISGGNKLSQLTYKWSFMDALDNTHIAIAQRNVLEDLVAHPWRTGNTKAEIVKMMEDRVFSDEVNAYLYNQIATLTNKPRIAHIQSYAYSPLGTLFYTFQSWVNAHTQNFVKPFLTTPYGHKIASLCWLVAMTGVSTYLKSVVNGTPYNLSSAEDREKFYQRMYHNGLDEFIGIYALTNTVATSTYQIATQPGRTDTANEIIKQRLPAINWANKLMTSAIRSLYDMSAIKDLLNSAKPNWWYLNLLSNNFL